MDTNADMLLFASSGSDTSSFNECIPEPRNFNRYSLAYSNRRYGRLCLAFFFLFLSMCSNAVVMSFTHDRVPMDSPPLPDLFFTNFMELPHMTTAAEIIIGANLFIALTVCLIHRYRFVILRRAFVCTGIAYIGRATCILVTQLPMPSPDARCLPQHNVTTPAVIANRIVSIVIRFGFESHTDGLLCGDLIYSGHTISLVMCYLFINHFSPRRHHVFLRWYALLTGTLAAVCILLARIHYTVDVLLAVFITRTIFYVYHVCADMQANSNIRANFIICPIVMYFEAGLKETLPLSS